MFHEIAGIMQVTEAPVATSSRRRGARELLVEAARRVLRTKSLEAMSMCDVAAEADLSRRTLYNYFIDKQQVYAASRAALLAGLSPLVPAAVDTDRPLAVALFDFGLRCTRLIEDDRYRELQLSIIRDNEPWLDQQFQAQIRQPLLGALEQFLSAQKASGQLRASSPLAAAIRFICAIEAAAISRRLIAISDRGSDFTVEQSVQELVDSFVHQHFVAADTWPSRAAA